jgi:hypothetical protein
MIYIVPTKMHRAPTTSSFRYRFLDHDVCKSTGYCPQDQMTNQQQLRGTRHFSVYILHVPPFVLFRFIESHHRARSVESARNSSQDSKPSEDPLSYSPSLNESFDQSAAEEKAVG